MTDLDPTHISNLENKFDAFGLTRYKNIKPYSYNRVPIKNSSTFINASWINLPYKNAFIATQAPIKNTIEDFWTMIWENKVNLIIMLCNVIEKNKEKSTRYWDKNIKMDKFILEYEGKKEYSKNLINRKFKLINKKDNTFIEVTQLQYLGWPDHGVPQTEEITTLFIAIFKMIDDLKKDSPVVVHCSAGVGRTGTFISLYNIYKEIGKQINDNSKEEIVFSIFNLVRKLKEMRIKSVENVEQYKLIYKFTDYLLKGKD